MKTDDELLVGYQPGDLDDGENIAKLLKATRADALRWVAAKLKDDGEHYTVYEPIEAAAAKLEGK